MRLCQPAAYHHGRRYEYGPISARTGPRRCRLGPGRCRRTCLASPVVPRLVTGSGHPRNDDPCRDHSDPLSGDVGRRRPSVGRAGDRDLRGDRCGWLVRRVCPPPPTGSPCLASCRNGTVARCGSRGSSREPTRPAVCHRCDERRRCRLECSDCSLVAPRHDLSGFDLVPHAGCGAVCPGGVDHVASFRRFRDRHPLLPGQRRVVARGRAPPHGERHCLPRPQYGLAGGGSAGCMVYRAALRSRSDDIGRRCRPHGHSGIRRQPTW